MSKPHQYVDLSKWPADEGEHLKALAMSHNALATRQDILEQEINGICGSTPEEKEAMQSAFTNFRNILKRIHGKRFEMAIGSFQLCLFLYVLKQFGINPEQVSRFFDVLLRILEKQA